MMSTFREEEIPLKDAVPADLPTGGGFITTTYELKNLSPHSNMVLRICVINNFFVGPPSDQSAFTTADGGMA